MSNDSSRAYLGSGAKVIAYTIGADSFFSISHDSGASESTINVSIPDAERLMEFMTKWVGEWRRVADAKS